MVYVINFTTINNKLYLATALHWSGSVLLVSKLAKSEEDKSTAVLDYGFTDLRSHNEKGLLLHVFYAIYMYVRIHTYI